MRKEKYKDSFKRLPLLLLVLGFLSVSPNTQASDGDIPAFSNANIQGRYVFSANGTASNVGPVAVIGQFIADGFGNITNGVNTVSLNGQIIQQTFTCSYNVSSNGTGTSACPVTTISSDSPGPATSTFSFVITNKSSEIEFVQTDPGVVMHVVARSQ